MTTLAQLLIDEVPHGFEKTADWTVGPDLVLADGRRMSDVEPVAMARLGFQRAHGRNWAENKDYATNRWLQAIVYEFATPDGARRHGSAEVRDVRRFTITGIPGASGTLNELPWGDKRAFISILHGTCRYNLGVNTRSVDDTMALLEPWARRQHEILTGP